MGSLHTAVAVPLIVVVAVLSLWSLAAHWIEAARTKVLWGFINGAHAVLFVHAMLGGIAVAADDRDVGQGHMFYGFLVLTGVAILYGYRRQLADYLYLLYGFGGLFVMGLAIRAATLEPWSALA